MPTIDLNCDVGEVPEPRLLHVERLIMRWVSSVNIACGMHAGSPEVMRHTVRLAKQAGVTVGAHPGFPDPAGGGRRPLPLARE